MKTSFVKTTIAWIYHKYCLLVYYTNKIDFINDDILYKQYESDEPIIFALWHDRLFFTPFIDKYPENTHLMISNHGDGELIARAIRLFGYETIRGSTNRTSYHTKGAKDRGGTKALRESVAILKRGKNIALTPDGPKGPRKIAKDGVVHIAKLSGGVILPISYSSSRCKIFNSWDKFILPFPFGKITLICGKPIKVSKTDDTEEKRIEIENELNTINEIVDEKYRIKS